jgi:hypothetical protein
MGILDRLFGRNEPEPEPEPDTPVVPADWTHGTAWQNWEPPRDLIAGESHNFTALQAMTGPATSAGHLIPVDVRFRRKPSRRWPHAIGAEVADVHIGYLRDQYARALAPLLDEAEIGSFAVPGILRGGSYSAPYVGCHVWLDRRLPGNRLAVKLDMGDVYVVSWAPQPWELH